MIIRRLLDSLWANGVTLVITSNRAPGELYKNGLNRVQFMPCIDAIEARCVVHPMESTRDYRLFGVAALDDDEKGTEATDDMVDESKTLYDIQNHSGHGNTKMTSGSKSGTWRVASPRPDSGSQYRAEGEAESWLRLKLRRLAKLAVEENMVRVEVAVDGRRVLINRASGGVAHLHFNEVCDSALGAADYTAIAAVFHTVGLSSVPLMTRDRLDTMRRFITFIDVLYEHKVKLLVVAAALPLELFNTGGKRFLSLTEEEFAWGRAASRLMEMSTSEYLEAPWRPKSGAWLLEQARVTEVIPASVLRALWQRYDADHNGVLDESELEELLADLNETRRGHRNVPEEQLRSAWEMLTNRGKRGLVKCMGMGVVNSTCAEDGKEMEAVLPSRRGDAFIVFDDFIQYGNDAFAACMQV
jgi:predicted ATPase